jgi:hypothetical protein
MVFLPSVSFAYSFDIQNQSDNTGFFPSADLRFVQKKSERKIIL